MSFILDLLYIILSIIWKVAINELKEDFQQMENDSNMLIITGKKSNKNEDKNDKNGDVPKKKKLSRKERMKLEKIVERKNKSSRVGFFSLIKKYIFCHWIKIFI